MHPSINCSSIYKIQDMERDIAEQQKDIETTQVSIKRRVDKGDMLHIHNGMLAIKKNKIIFCHLKSRGWTMRLSC